MSLLWDRSVAKKRPHPDDIKPGLPRKEARYELRVDESWLARVERQAERFGMTVAAYIRQATTARLEADEASQPAD